MKILIAIIAYNEEKNIKNVILDLKNNNFGYDIILKVLMSIEYEFPTIVSPDAIINEEVKIGDGTVIMDGVVINSGSKIESFCIINTKSSIDHDCIINSYVHIAPGVTLCGGVEIGNNCLIGTGATIIQYKKIIDNTIIGAGSTIIKSIEKPGKYIKNSGKLLLLKN